MHEIEALLETDPYGLDCAAKEQVFIGLLRELTQHHRAECVPYRNILDALRFDPDAARKVDDFPFLTTQLFKHHSLASVGKEGVRKILTSSGTSGGAPSRIFLDARTASLTQKTLARIVGNFIGRERLPMLVIDARSTVSGRDKFSARAAAILGFSMFGRNVTFALKDDMSLDIDALDSFCCAHRNEPVLVFGFTFMVYQNLIEALSTLPQRWRLERATLIHGGGWKKLADVAVDGARFKAMLEDTLGITRVHNYYGLVEQTGSIFVECEHGHLHCSIFSDLLIRDSAFDVRPRGARGLVEVVSLLPRSYPGHVLLTEDEGTIEGEDDCACGRLGKYFRIHGRAARAEIRGCSDAHAV